MVRNPISFYSVRDENILSILFLVTNHINQTFINFNRDFVCLFVYFFFILGPYSEENLSIPLFFHMAQSQNTTSKLHYQ